jgi:hypothetical protein
MINQKINEFMSTSPNSLKEFSEFINKLIKEHGREQIISISGVDKNVLYRASTSQNITLENYYKIKQAFNNQLKTSDNSEFIAPLPILGRITDDTKVSLLNPTQPTSVPVPTAFVEQWSPTFGYLNVNSTAYSGFVYIFSGKLIKNCETINNSCINRLIMAYPEEGDPLFGMVLKQEDSYSMIHPITRKVISKIPYKNNISWAKFTTLIPYSLMEDHKEEGYQNNIHKLEDSFLKRNI